MENEILKEKSNRYSESGLYNKLRELHPHSYNVFFEDLVKVARSSNEKELLLYSDILLEFGLNEKNMFAKEKVVDTVVNDIFPILNERVKKKKNPELIKDLISNEYGTVSENLQLIGEEISNEEISSKCLFGQAVLTFPGSEIIEGDKLDS